MREYSLEPRTYCPVCGAANFRWHPLPNYYLNAWRKFGFKQSGACEMTPIHTYGCSCGASDRERLYAFFLQEVMQAKEGFMPERMIHFAPEAALSRHIRAKGYFTSYKTADFSMPGVDYQVDLQALPFDDNHFDCFICSHVLEHVPDDRMAIRELYRVTRPGGFGILMAPIFRIPQTLEDPSITDTVQRWRLFGQNDHVRLYSHDDYVRKIEESGFLLHQLTEKDFGADVFRQLGLKPSSILYVVSKPPAQAAEGLHPVDAAIERLQNRAFSNNPAEGQEPVTPKVSVILTSYNHDGFLDEAIQSVLAQTYRNFELIIWDDASSDDSWAIIEQYDDPRILSFRNEFNRYGVYGVNKAINEVARGEYIAIHHSDDVWELEKLEKQVAFLDQHPETGAVFSWANIMDVEGNYTNDVNLYQIFRQENKTRHEWLRQLYRYNGLCHPSVLIRKQCYTDCGLYNPALRQLPDMEMWIRLCFKYEIHVLPEDLIRFRWNASGSNTSNLLRDSIFRQMVEGYTMLDKYRQIASREDLVKIFPATEKYCARPDADLEFALAMTAFESGGLTPHALLSLKWLYNLMASPEKAEKIRAIHHFDHLDFANLTGQVQIFAERQPATVPPVSVSVAPLERGIQAFNHENYEAAIECLSTAMTEEPENPLPAAYLAFICVQQGLVTEARDFIAQAEKLAPDRADLIAALGEVLLKNNRPLEAVEYLREAVNRKRDLFAAYPALAQSLHLTGQSAEAIALLQAVSVIPSNDQANIQTTLTQIQAEST
jgi:glycosyltransferase involved in cell wall biosynthesis